MGVNGVPVAPHGLILRENEATPSRKLLKHLPDLKTAINIKRITKKHPINRPGGRYVIEMLSLLLEFAVRRIAACFFLGVLCACVVCATLQLAQGGLLGVPRRPIGRQVIRRDARHDTKF